VTAPGSSAGGSCHGERRALRAIHRRPRPPSPHATRPNGRSAVIWQDVECGSYTADLKLWEELARDADGPILELGCGMGRVALHLARRGHEVVGIDADEELLAAAAERGAGLPFSAVHGDARDFDLDREFALVLAPMQVLQLLGGEAERGRCLASVRRHLRRPGGVAALAIVERMPEPVPGPPPLPDVRELGGWVYSSLPLDAIAGDDAIAVRRLRQTVSPDGSLSDELDEVRIEALTAGGLEREAAAAGLVTTGRRDVPATDAHVGSTVILVEGGG
jgi:SAM-dependent methyltransferase